MLFLGYVFILAYFNFIDVYHHEFFTTGFTIISYNAIRICFIFYLMWLFYAAGDFFLNLASQRLDPTGKPRDDGLKSTLLAFFAGVGIWHIVLLCIGFAGLYTRTCMATITLALLTVSLPKLSQFIDYLSKNRKSIYWQGWLTLLIPLFFFLITKGLYPAGGHDYFTHYFPYYLKVVESGSIMPNNVWYHFYYSKGDGLFFLSMLLTDPLAPQLATTALMIGGAAVIFLMLRPSASRWRLLPWIGAALYITFLIYTPGTEENIRQGGCGWADLEKAHEPASVLMLATIWLTIGLARAQRWRTWGITLLLTVSALILISPYVSIYAGTYLCMAAIALFFCNKKTAAIWALLGACTAAIWLIFLLTINYLLTGLPDEQQVLAFWPFINFDKIQKWGVTFEVLDVYHSRLSQAAGTLPLTFHFIANLISYIRLDVWGPLFAFAMILVILSLFNKTWRRSVFTSFDKAGIYATSGLLILTLFLSCFIGRDQPVSYYRYTIFTYAPMLCFCLFIISASLRQTRLATIIFLISFYVSWVKFYPYLNYNKSNARHVITNGMRFITGQYSIADGYQHQEGLSGRMPWGAIYPAAKEIWSQLPPKTRIWSMHIHSYCMLPDCYMEGYYSFRLSPHANTVFYGDPQEAKMWLKNEGLNYFFFSTSLSIKDALSLAPLFSPAHIGDHLGIAWTNGKDTLLTWKEQARYPLNADWLKKYKQATDESRSPQQFPYHEMRAQLEIINKKLLTK